MTNKVCSPDSLLQYISVIFLFKKKKNRKEDITNLHKYRQLENKLGKSVA